MTDEADTVGTPAGGPTAGAQELTIPKWRLDEVSSQVKALREELTIKNQLLNDVTQRHQPQAVTDEIPIEETGLDPQTYQAAIKIARKIAKTETEGLKKEFRSMIGMVGNDVEATKFLINHGNDKGAYLDRIRAHQKRHVETTGGYIDMETAYKLIRFDEMSARGQRATDPVVPQQQIQQPVADPAYPNPAMTRVQPAGGGVAQAKTFADLTEEEMEARLTEALQSGQTI